MLSLPVKNTEENYEVNPSKIIALGMNYKDHIDENIAKKTVKEEKSVIPDEPILFNKTPNVLIGPEDKIILPSFINKYGFENPRTDYEAELAVIMGKKGKHIAQEEANEYIFGYTCMNDVSQRNLQTGDKSGWFRGKSLDTFGPIGPQIVKSEDIGNPDNLDISARLNGETVQSSNTNQMIFPVSEIVSFVSDNFTLNPGDIIMTGTPSGVGALSAGDTIEIEIENIGALENEVDRESNL